MSTIPKLALLPSGYKASKVYSVLPTDGTGDFTFSRAGALPSYNATRVNSEGLIEEVLSNVPRLNYPIIDGVVSGCPSLLLEPERRNLITYSENFVTDWNNTNITVNSNSNISPDGSLNGTKFIPNTTSGQHYLDRNAVTVNSNASASIFAKKGEYKRFAIRSYFTGGNAIFDVENGVIVSTSSVTAKIENYGNGWFRCSLNETLNANYGYGVFVMESDSTNPLDNYTGNNVDGMYFYGAQLELGSYPTSYIPNFGTALGVTRVAETANGAGDANTFNDSEGVLFAEISALADDVTDRVLGVSDGSANNRIILYYNSSNNLVAQVYSISNNLQSTITVTDLDITNFSKASIKYDTNSIKLYLNGFLRESKSIATAPINLSELAFDNGIGGADFYGNTKQIQYFDSALNDTELETLTSWTSFSEMATSQLYSIE